MRLYRDDLEEIEAIFRSLTSEDGQLTVSSDSWRAASVDELARQEQATRISKAEMWLWHPHRSLTFSVARDGAYVSIPDDNDVEAYGAYMKIIEVASRRQLLRGRLSSWMHKHFVLTYGLLVPPLLVFLIVLGLSGPAPLTLALAFTPMLVWMVVWTLSAYYLFRGSFVTLARRHDSPSFLRRNRDAISVGLLLSLFSIAVGYALRMLIE